MKLLLISLSIYFTQALQLRESHQSWFEQAKPTGTHPSPAWANCDQRCIDFEKELPDTDFYIVTFSAGSALNMPKTACYGADTNGVAKLWN